MGSGSASRPVNPLTFFSDSDPKKLNVSLLTVVVSSSSAMLACDGSNSNSDLQLREVGLSHFENYFLFSRGKVLVYMS